MKNQKKVVKPAKNNETENHESFKIHNGLGQNKLPQDFAGYLVAFKEWQQAYSSAI
jgi:hypothetical protein